MTSLFWGEGGVSQKVTKNDGGGVSRKVTKSDWGREGFGLLSNQNTKLASVGILRGHIGMRLDRIGPWQSLELHSGKNFNTTFFTLKF